ncbi:hypothetical protein PQ462_09755 [Flavobacterium sp. KACC 22758]|uniref:hypothetical protein n=1 Tax=Flavobacterium sp. KACC 22758 TaxID=3025667 RepID=UPI0023658814|nr:hypothetical protein [Flavobacterium sp. KACC 22758]WDF61656.1 hypothetical protein PQ462_09755 [Flavobacterium sp. KACC 22758]
METDEIKKLETIRVLSGRLLNTLKPADDKRGMYNAEIRIYDYCELVSIIKNLMKLCIIALDRDSAEVPPTIQNQNIDAGLILGIALQLFPVEEFELLNEITYLFSENKEETEQQK